jgi:hypothetical protein
VGSWKKGKNSRLNNQTGLRPTRNQSRIDSLIKGSERGSVFDGEEMVVGEMF